MYVTTVTQIEKRESLKSSPEEGVYLEGLMLEGAAFSKNGLVESEPKVLSSNLPVLHVTAMSTKAAAARKKGMELVAVPLYKYSVRGDKNLLCFVDLPCGEKTANHWILRGVSLLANA